MIPMAFQRVLLSLAGTMPQPVPDQSFRLFPESAASRATQIDDLFFALVGMALMLMLLLFGMMGIFLVRYRAGSHADRSDQIQKTWKWELSWISAATVIGIGLFIWAGVVYIRANHAPDDTTTYYVVGKQWMWTIQHPTGRQEINELHVPVGQPVKLVLSSKDVIHSFYVPAFRVKQDAVPGMYTTEWFTPTKPGAYHLFCAEYCGADHARMKGTVYVMKPNDYQEWLRRNPVPPTAQPMSAVGENTFRALGCFQCHKPDTDSIAPYLEGIYGRKVKLRDGSTVIADEQYIRESIINPAAKVVQGYQPIMPTYKGILDEKQIAQLVAAVRALGQDTSPEEKK